MAGPRLFRRHAQDWGGRTDEVKDGCSQVPRRTDTAGKERVAEVGGRDRWAPGGSAPDSARSVFPVSRVSLSYAPCGDGTQRRSFLGCGRRAEEQAQGVSNLKVPADINLLLAHLRRSHGSAPSQQRKVDSARHETSVSGLPHTD